MHFKTQLAVVCFAILSVSCTSIALGIMGIYNKDATTAMMTNGEKVVAYIPMKHIAPKEFYANVKHKTDSLQAEGYIVFMESVRAKKKLSKAEKDTLDRKLRKITGTYISSSGYIDTLNHTLMGRKFKNRRNLVNQPRYTKLGVDTLTGRVVDIPVNELVAAYEKENGVVRLSECDFNTPLGNKYKCGSEAKSKANEMILNFRNKHLANTIANEPHKKIAVLYGALHERGLYSELHTIDSAWVYKQ